MRKKTRERIFFWIRILIALGAIAYIIFKFDLSQMWEELTLAFKRPEYVLLSCAAFLGFMGFISLRWLLLARARNQPYGFFYLYRSVWIHMLFNNVLPTTIGGDVYRIMDTSGHQGKGKAFSVVWVDRLCGFIGVFSFAFMASIFYTAATGNFVLMLVLGGGLCFALATIVVFLSKKINRWIVPRLSKLRLFKYPVGEKISEAFTYVTLYRDRVPVLLLAVLVSLGVQICLVGVWYFLYLSLPQSGNATFVHFMVTIPLVNTAAIFSVGGWGVREVAFVNILGAFSLTVSQSTSLANSILFDAVNVFFGVLGGLFLLFRRSRKPVPAEIETPGKQDTQEKH